MSIGIWQIAIVVILVVLLFGRGKISSLMGDVAKGIKAYNQILAGQLSREEIEKCSKNPEKKLTIKSSLVRTVKPFLKTTILTLSKPV